MSKAKLWYMWAGACIIAGTMGCSALSPLSAIKPSPGIEASANVGRTASQEKSTVKLQQGGSQTAEAISNDSRVQADSVVQQSTNVPAWLILIVVLLAGWAIPSPKECVRGLFGLFKRKRAP